MRIFDKNREITYAKVSLISFILYIFSIIGDVFVTKMVYLKAPELFYSAEIDCVLIDYVTINGFNVMGYFLANLFAWTFFLVTTSFMFATVSYYIFREFKLTRSEWLLFSLSAGSLWLTFLRGLAITSNLILYFNL